MHAPTSNSSNLNDWGKARKQEYEDRLNGRNGMRLVKSSGERLWEASREPVLPSGAELP